MLSVQMDEVNGIAILEPDGPLSEDDFKSAAKVIDPWIEKSNELNGLIIHTESFPGWESFAALSSHLVFVKEHHKKIARVALATDSKAAGFANTIAKHFVKAEIKLFPYKNLEEAKLWVVGRH
jgi:SpoIIAA-like